MGSPKQLPAARLPQGVPCVAAAATAKGVSEMSAHMWRRSAGACLILLSVVACNETPESTYRTLEEARRAGAIERGWIPESVPAFASNIREKHDLDTNEVWGAFEFPEERRTAVVTTLRSVPSEYLRGRAIGSGGVAWWPRSLEQLDEQLLNGNEYTFFVTPDGFFMALEQRRPNCFFWHKRSWPTPRAQ